MKPRNINHPADEDMKYVESNIERELDDNETIFFRIAWSLGHSNGLNRGIK
jgi:hypothetical protein